MSEVLSGFARRIVGWRVGSLMQTDLVLKALEQALYARQPERVGSLVCHWAAVRKTSASATYCRPRLRQTIAGISPIRLPQRPELSQLASTNGEVQMLTRSGIRSALEMPPKSRYNGV